MKALSGGLITNSAAAYAFEDKYDNVLPIWGVQREKELDEFLSYIACPPAMTDEIKTIIEKDQKELSGNFCRALCLKRRTHRNQAERRCKYRNILHRFLQNHRLWNAKHRPEKSCSCD